MLDAAPRGTEWSGWGVHRLAGDASSRRYARLTGPGGETVILMDTGPDAANQVPRFVRIADHLRGLGLCAPAILWRAPDDGTLILEDLGPHDVARHLAAAPDECTTVYAAAVDVLLVLSRSATPTGLAALTPAHGAGMIAPVFDWFARGTPAPLRTAIAVAMEQALQDAAPVADTLALRDYHAENLIWRGERRGTDRVGLLDFQDALVAPAEYDLASLLRDARRDVDAATRAAAIRRFADGTGRDEVTVAAACAVLGVQRNLRILGIFARLARQDGKRRYLDLIPRVRAQIAEDLSHPAAAGLAGPVTDLLRGAT